jgi:hypothetical protein
MRAAQGEHLVLQRLRVVRLDRDMVLPAGGDALQQAIR